MRKSSGIASGIFCAGQFDAPIPEHKWDGGADEEIADARTGMGRDRRYTFEGAAARQSAVDLAKEIVVTCLLVVGRSK